MAKEITANGQGFLTATGALKDRKTLASEDARESKKSEPPRVEEDQKDIRSALNPVRSRVREDVNAVISVANQNAEKIKQAEELVKKQDAAARELKLAMKEEDLAKAEEKRAELERLQNERNALAKKVEDENRELDPERRRSISLGNKELKTVEVKRVEFKESQGASELKDKEDVNKFIKSLEADKASLTAQRQELKAVRKDAKDALNQAQSDIKKIEQDSIKSIEEAAKKAEKIAAQIVKAGSQEALVSNIEEKRAGELLSA